MNLRTTIILTALLGIGAGIWFAGPWVGRKVGLLPKPIDAAGSGSSHLLETRMTRGSLQTIEVQNGNSVVVFERGVAGQWALTGRWATRQQEVNELIGLLSDLQSRFIVTPLASTNDAELKRYGLDADSRTVTIHVTFTDGSKAKLLFGEPAAVAGSPFARPTYVRIDDRSEVVRLGPDMLPILRRPREYYQRRQLFPAVERVRVASATSQFGPPSSDSSAVPLPKAKALSIEGPLGKITVRKVQELPQPTGAGLPKIESIQIAEAWEITEPVKDRVEPEKIKSLLASIPELWVEDFKKLDAATMIAEETAKSPAIGIDSLLEWIDAAAKGNPDQWLMQRTGLDRPERTVRVTLSTDDVVVLNIGRISQTKERKGTPPPPNPMMPVPPPPPIIREDYHFAKLEGQSQVFEIRADKFNDLFVTAAVLRDDKLARFKAADAQQLDIALPERSVRVFNMLFRSGGGTIVLKKEKDDRKVDRWRVFEPIQALAENDKVTELINRLEAMDARDKDILDAADLKSLGFDPPTGIRIDVQIEEPVPGSPEPVGDAKKPTRKRTVTFVLGKHDAIAKKLYVRVAGRERTNLVNEDVLKLAERPALAYRSRRILDFETVDIAAIEIQRSDESYRLQQSEGDWKLTAPVSASADRLKSANLADELSRLEAVEYVKDAPKPSDMSAAGLDKPALTVTIHFADTKRKPVSISIGHQSAGKQEYFAKLQDGGIFVIKKDTRDKLDVKSLDYRPTQLWTAAADAISQVKITRADGAYELKKSGFDWKIAGPFDATASLFLVQPLLEALANPRLSGYQAHKTEKPAEFGLEKPALQVSFTIMEKGKEGEPDKPRERTIQFGKPVEGKGDVFARLSDDPAVLMLPEAVKINADKSALDLLDRRLLFVDARRANKLQRSGTATHVASKTGMDWKIDAGGTTFAADRPTIDGVLRTWQALQADRFAAYGAQIDMAKFGLNPPVDSLTLTLDPETPDGKPATHVLKFGKPVDGGAGRYSRLDDQPAVAILTPAVVTELMRTHLDFVDKSLLKFDAVDLTAIRRQMPSNDLEISRQGGWKILKPVAQPADEPMLDDLAEKLSVLRADRIADYDAKDLKKYGLDAAAATVTMTLPEKDGKPQQFALRIGLPVDPKAPDGDRFVRVDESKVIGVLAGHFVKRLLGEPLKFRDRNLVTRLPEPDRVVVERGDRAGANRAVFSRIDGSWKLTAPVAAEAEHADLEDFLNNVYKLRADEFVAEKPADLKPFGLDKPESVLRFMVGEKEILALSLGKKDSTDQRCYARMASSDVVFLLEPKITIQALAEYRKRTLWTGFDAAQVEVLTISGDGGPFVLRKVSGTWQMEGKPEFKVDQNIVTEAITALGGLKVERYIRDKDAPLDLYGLAKPRRTIVAQTGMGMRQEIRLGNLEGGSKRAYAGLPGKTEVFVLSDSDTAKLDRDAKAFQAK